MAAYIVANEHGEIIKSGNSSSLDISVQARPRQFAMFIPDIPEKVAERGLDASRYVEFKKDGPEVVERPKFDAPDTINAKIGEKMKIRGLPKGTIVYFDGKEEALNGTVLDMAFPCAGEFELTLKLFPYVPKKIGIVVT